MTISALAVGVGVMLRVYAALGDFWLDEIWSFAISQQAKSLFDVIHFKVDNNHALNTMLMRLIGDQPYWPLYRVPSVIAGGASIALAGLIARRWSAAGAVFATILFALSFPLVLYGSEARGYSLAVMFMLLAIWLQLRLSVAPPDSSPSRTSREAARIVSMIVAFWLACALGLLSHPLFLQPYLALLGWAIVEAAGDRGCSPGIRIRRVFVRHLVPVAFVGLLFAAHWNGMQIGGGEERSPFAAIASACALMLGTHGGSFVWISIVGASAATMTAAGMVWLIRKRDAMTVFAILGLIVVPLSMLAVLRPTVLYERYFLMQMVIALLVMAGWLGAMASRSTVGRIAAMALLAAFVAPNLVRDVRLIQIGRGHYLEALELIAANTAGPEIVIGSDHDFRNQATISFYMRFIGKPVRYIQTKEWTGSDGEWFIVHSFDDDREPGMNVTDRAGVRWTRVANYDANDISGLRWYIYHRVSP